MKSTSLQMTEIQCQKLLHRVGQDRLSPYQVTVSRGKRLGVIGPVMTAVSGEACNQPLTDRSSASLIFRVWHKLFSRQSN